MAIISMTFTLDYVAYAVVAVVLSLLLRKKRSSPKLPYPPGPKGLPLIGNILDIPSTRPWLTYAKWAQQLSEFLGHPQSSVD
jgi:hypothetical protein